MAGKAAPCSHNGHDAYFLSWSPNAAYRRHGTDEKYLHLPIKEVQTRHYDGPVFNIEVAQDHSYVTDIVLHNCEAYVAPRTHKDKDSQKDTQKETRHLTLWAKNKVGYQNLVKLTTRAHLDGFYYKPRVDHELLAEYSEGIICGSACLGGEIPQLIMAKKLDEARARAEKYRDIFGKENFFLELMDHDLHGQDEVNNRLIDIHHQTGIPLICSNDAHYLTSKDEEMHKILVAIGTNSQIDSMALHYGPNFYLKSQDEMWDKFKHVPSALENTLLIADMVDLELDLKTTHFPNYDVPSGHDKTSFLRQMCKDRFDKRYPIGHQRRAEAQVRMEYELKVIIDKGYPGYFLVVQDFINWSKERGILVGCRGSAAGCLVSYVLGITNLDPLPYGLLFERFLNPERVSMPDIDVDFPDKRRDEVLKYITEKYGKEKVAQIITFGTLAARAAVRDTARATGLDLKLADQVSKLIPAIPGQPITIKRAIAEVKELGDLYSNDSTVTMLLDRAQKIEGMTRHASRHACGLVIGEERLDNLVPLEEKDGVIITQYHAKAVEKIGLVKMDMLGLQNNTVINDTLDLIKTRHGVEIDLENIDLTDKKVYDMMGRGDGIAVFQMEGVGMRNLLREMKPENMEHIIAQISLYRPGPMEEIPRYVAGRHGGKVTYPHPKMEPILKNTYGMLLYQEQVMQAAQELAGFTGGQADELRGAMAKKKADQMALLKPLFIEGCFKNKITKSDATDIFDKMETFAKYAFNKSHAAYYGLVSYWTGYLKVNYASEFMACKMTSLLGNKDKLLIIIDDCRKHQIEVLAPDVNESNHDFTVVGMGEKAPIRFGLQAIKGIGEGPVNAIIEARQSGGKFISLHDFCERVPLRGCNKSCIETLIKSGGFDSILPNRQSMIEGLDGAISSAQAAQADALSGQTNMFLDAAPEAGRPKTTGVLPDVEDAPSEKKLLWEKEYVGLYISDHPLNPLVDFLDANAVPLGKISDGGGFSDGARLTIGGLATKVQKRTDKNGRNWAIFSLEDLTGSMEVLAFAKTFEKCGSCVSEDAKLLVTGRLSADNRGARPQSGGEEEGEEQIRFKMMADDIEIISDEQVQAAESRPARPKTAPSENGNGSAVNGSNGNGTNGNAANGNGVKGHVLLDALSTKNEGSRNGHANGNGAQSNGSGFSFSRSSAPSVTLPPPDSAPSFASSGASSGGSEEEGPARIGYGFAPPVDAGDAVHVHVPAGAATREIINRLYNVCRRHPGATQLWLHVDNGEEMVQLKVSASYWVNADEGFCGDVATLLGGENVLVPEI
ncbi:DNA polymerase III subunit alpha [Abditibacterium utsteinense]